MGCGEWDTNSFIRYSTSKGLATDSLGFVTSSVSNQEMFKARSLDPVLDPNNTFLFIVVHCTNFTSNNSFYKFHCLHLI